MTWPDCVPGRMSRSLPPSSVSTDKVAPRAADTIGIVTVQWRSSPSRSKIGCARWTISRNRSPGGPPPGPISPSPASWMWVPSSTPGGLPALEGARGAHRAARVAFGARPPDDGAVAAAGGTRPGGHDLAEEGPGDLAHLAAPRAHVARLRMGAGRGALARAGGADHR